MRYVVAWLILALGFAIGLGSLNWRTYCSLATRGVRAQATILELHPEEHASARYRYRVDGRILEGQRSPSRPNPPLDQLRVGQTVIVYCDPRFPQRSVLGDPQPILLNETGYIAAVALLFPTIIVLRWRSISRRRARKTGNESSPQ